MGIFYTIQTIEAYKSLIEKGHLITGKEFIFKEIIPAYEWMTKQMNKRINCNVAFPIWLWTEKPDLEDEGHFEPNVQAVCITVSIPEDRVLLSHFDAWHCVLNDSFCPLNNKDDDLFEQGESDISKEDSWERIFELELLRNSDVWKQDFPTIQGVTGAISKDQIVSVEYFVAK